MEADDATDRLAECAERTERLFDRGAACLRDRFGPEAPMARPMLLAAYVDASASQHMSELRAGEAAMAGADLDEAMQQLVEETLLQPPPPRERNRRR